MKNLKNVNYYYTFFLDIYRKVLPLGKFCAILATYFVSSLLHGFNVEIAVVLLSIGLFSYIQLRFQDKLSEDLNACVQIRGCRQCHHKYKRNSSLVTVLTIILGIFTILHLAYLGQLMDAIGNPNSSNILKKWENLQFCSHLIMFFAYLYCLSWICDLYTCIDFSHLLVLKVLFSDQISVYFSVQLLYIFV